LTDHVEQRERNRTANPLVLIQHKPRVVTEPADSCCGDVANAPACPGTLCDIEFAVQIDRRLLRALRRLDVDQPIAETWRALRPDAIRFGVARPSYHTIRLYVLDERARRSEHAALVSLATEIAMTGRIPPTVEDWQADLRDARRRQDS
jgi:hypothetical protein